MKRPTISVIVPVYNAQRYLAEAIQSILAQGRQPDEIIVVDDGSTDGSAAIAGKFADKIRFFQQENKGAGAARNLGVKMCTGSLLAFLDADDTWTPNKLSLQLKTLDADPDLDFVLGTVHQFVSPELGKEARCSLRSELKTMPAYHVGAMLIKRPSFYNVGFFNEDLQLGEYIDWFNRAKHLELSYCVLDETVLGRRIHTHNQGIYKKAHLKDYIAVLKSSLDRRRIKTA